MTENITTSQNSAVKELCASRAAIKVQSGAALYSKLAKTTLLFVMVSSPSVRWISRIGKIEKAWTFVGANLPIASTICMGWLQSLAALLTHSRALLALKKGIAEERIDLRTRILLCIVLVCFETYHGNNPGATSQIFAGIEMIGQYMRNRAIAQLSNEGHLYPALDEGILMLFAILEVQVSANSSEDCLPWRQLLAPGTFCLDETSSKSAD